jgi:hypothetical protein
MGYSSTVICYAWGMLVLCLFASPNRLAHSFLSRKFRFFNSFRTLFKTGLARISSFQSLAHSFVFHSSFTPCRPPRQVTGASATALSLGRKSQARVRLEPLSLSLAVQHARQHLSQTTVASRAPISIMLNSYCSPGTCLDTRLGSPRQSSLIP